MTDEKSPEASKPVTEVSDKAKLKLAKYCSTRKSSDECLVQCMTPQTLVASSSPLYLDVWQTLLKSKDLRPGSGYKDALRHLVWCFILEEADLSSDSRGIDARGDMKVTPSPTPSSAGLQFALC